MASQLLRWVLKRGTYHDSLQLMEVHAVALALPGVVDAACVMGTERNQQLMAARGLLPEGLVAGPDDLLIVLRGGDRDELEAALQEIDDSLATRQAPFTVELMAPTSNARTLDGALERLGGANVALISVPGAYAAAEAARALHRGLHVHLFSDNVAIEDEIALKRLAHERGLLLMGPECGTAILNGAPLGFANVVRRGPVGIVGASGTGIQQATVLLDRLGVGVSHAIGVGGRDLSGAVGGLMTLDALDALARDTATRVILLISKPPAAEALGRVVSHARALTRPVVVCFLGAEMTALGGLESGQTIEEAVLLAASHAETGDGVDRRDMVDLDAIDIGAVVASEAKRLRPTQTQVRGLYVGGTLAHEAKVILNGVNNAVVDLGNDEFTQGRPHPMIDPSLRSEWLRRDALDPEVAVLLCDVVLGFGSHADPAGALAAAVRQARSLVEASSAHVFPSVVASVCGTRADPQGLDTQEQVLREAGVLLFPTNAQAARAAAAIATRGASVRVAR